MKLLNRYLFRQFVLAFLFTSVAFVLLFTLIDMVENLDDLFDHGIGAQDTLYYYLLTLPATFQLTAPLSALLATILTAGRLAASSELSAMLSAGITRRNVLFPFLLGAGIICAINLINATITEPAAASAKISFERTRLNETRKGTHENTNIHILEPDNRIVTIGRFNPVSNQAMNVTVEKFGGPHLLSRTDALVMRFETGVNKWIMQDGAIRTFGDNPGSFAFRRGNDTLELALTVQSLRELNVLPEEMNLLQHYRYVQEKMQAGFTGLDRARVKLHAKAAMPLTSLAITLIGVPLALIKKRNGRAAEIALALFIGFLFLGIQRTLATMGYNGVIEPWIAAWLPLLLCLGTGLSLWHRSDS